MELECLNVGSIMEKCEEKFIEKSTQRLIKNVDPML